MEKNDKIKIGIAIALVAIIIAFVIFNIFSLRSVEATSFRITQVGITENADILFEGVIGVENPSLIDARITGMEYEIILDATDELLAAGQITGAVVPAGGSAEFEFSNAIEWIPDPMTALGLMSEEHVYVTIQGTVNAKLLWIFPVSSDFTAKADIARYLKNVIQEQVQNLMGFFGTG